MPSKGRAGDVADRPIVLSRGRLLLEIRLPIGSADGKYNFLIVNKSKKVHKTAEATARTEDHVTRLKVALDTSGLSLEITSSACLEPGLNEWSDYPLKVK